MAKVANHGAGRVSSGGGGGPAAPYSSRRGLLVAAIVVNVAIVVLELAGFANSWREMGVGIFQYYTEDSNLLLLVACAVLLVLQVRVLRDGGGIPAWAGALKLAGVSVTMVTLIVVVLILTPAYGDFVWLMTEGSMLYHHFLCPVLGLVSFLAIERRAALPPRAVLLATVPTLVYGAVAVVLNIARIWEGPYPFLLVYEQSILMSAVWCIVILGGAALLAWGIRKANAGRRG